jgi:transcriptional regulator with XRE-family HTH domain
MDSSERVVMIRKIKNLSRQKFADSLKISVSYLRTVESGKSEPSYRFIKALTEAHRVNTNWIITGEGKMFLGEEHLGDEIKHVDVYEQVAQLEANLRDAQKKLSLIRSLI